MSTFMKENGGTSTELERGGGATTTTADRKVTFCDEILFADGTRVHIHRLIDQGEFRWVYMGRNVRTNQMYALKKVDCQDQDQVEQCQKEVTLHGRFHHENIMPLLGVKFVQEFDPASKTICYMLLPFLPHSLGDDITKRRLLDDVLESKRRPYTQNEALTLFAGIVSAVKSIHNAGFSHRDIKVENVLLQPNKEGRHGKRRNVGTPLLTDFGSAGPANAPLPFRSNILRAIEDAELFTTVAYRAPELFGGGLAYGPLESLHYDHADVWSLGCLLFAILYGASPFEMEWRVSLVEGAAAEGTVRIVECTYQKVLQDVPFPPCGSAADRRYGEDVKDLIRWMLKRKDRERPTTTQVLDQIEIMETEKDKPCKSQ